jgi:myosin heavy subunit
VRCIKPNAENRSGVFDSKLVSDQLRFAGVLETVRVTRAGFPNRLEFKEFVTRYKSVVSGVPNGSTSTLDRVRFMSSNIATQLLESDEYKVPIDVQGIESHMVKAGVQIGKTKVFLRRQTFDLLESLRLRGLVAQAVKIQTVFRMTYMRRQYEMLRSKAIIIQCWHRLLSAVRVVKNMRIAKAAKMINRYGRGMVCRRLRRRVLKGVRLLQLVCKLRYALRRHRAAVMIQCKARCRKAIKQFREAKRDRMNLLKVMADRDRFQHRAEELRVERDDLTGRVKSLQETQATMSAQLSGVAAKLAALEKLREQERLEFEDMEEEFEMAEMMWRSQTFCQRLCRLFKADPERPAREPKKRKELMHVPK